MAESRTLPEPMDETISSLVYQPQCPIPARDLQHMRHRVRDVVELAAQRRCRIAVPGSYRPVNQQRPSDDILARHKAPIAAVFAVVAVVSHHEVVSLWNNQLAIFDELTHLEPPLATPWQHHREIEPGKVVAEQIVRG